MGGAGTTEKSEIAASSFAVIIPAFNEADSLESVLTELAEVKKQNGLPLVPIVVNDCSADATVEIALKNDCQLIDLPINLGIGGAVQTGIRFAYEKGYELAVQVDGDGQHPSGEIARLIKRLRENNSDLVIGSRFLQDTGFRSTFWRRLGIRYFRSLIKLFCGADITDCTSGFRAINRRTMELVSRSYPDQYPEPESIILFAFNGLKICEIPVVMRPRLAGVSSIGKIASLYYAVKVTLAIFFAFVRLKSWKT
jgi:glycosyltransferase involved in cell wall biosynthesis